MDLNELKLFLDLSNTLHFAKTSRNCHISPSALSRTIQRLEEEVGRPLFYRDNRTVTLSDAGKQFRIFVQDTLDSWERLRNNIAEEQTSLQGELFLYCSVTAAYGVLSDIFARFRELYPRVHIRLETGDAAAAIEKVRSGTVDITAAARPEQLPAVLLFKPITRTDLVFIGPRVSCDVSGMIDDGDFRWDYVPLILAEQALSRKRAEAWFREKGLKPNIYAEVGGHEAILSMVRLGCGIGVLPRLVIENSLFKDEVRVIETKPGLEPYEVGLCVHRRRMTSQVVRAFWDIVARC